MSNPIVYKSFNAASEPLEGSNLIEASAGTGKTYSIAILVLRLLLEKKLSVKEILMVTFTKAAVAELEERIRLFIRSAYKASQGNKISDVIIQKLVKDAIGRESGEEVQTRLKEAVLFLDETSVLTIHSFCQQSLNEFAFETRQVFGAEPLQDIGTLLSEQVAWFWRKYITTLPVELLEYLIPAGLSQSGIIAILKEHLGGKRFIDFDTNAQYSCCSQDHVNWSQNLAKLKEKEDALRQCLKEHVEHQLDAIIEQCGKNAFAKKNALPILPNIEAFLNFLWDKRDKVNIIKVFGDPDKPYGNILLSLQECDEALQAVHTEVQRMINYLYCLAIQEATVGFRQYKQHNNLQTFDDMIVNLHSALERDNSDRLVGCLQKKYKAVFVDEFQDTDRLQYDIFQKAFGKDTILFYIGDPKQSIYAWRKADIQTYFLARSAVGNVYNMNHNYRSSEAFIQSMNDFFDLEDPFYFKGSQSEDPQKTIEYFPVESPEPNTKGQLLERGEPAVPITFTLQPNKGGIFDALVAQVVTLLDHNAYQIRKGGKSEVVRPSDIGILVRTNKEGAAVKERLAKYGIPSVTISDAMVLNSPEAQYVWYVLQAMVDPSPATINRALLSPFTVFHADTILKLREEKAIELFKNYKRLWEEDGVYTALMQFVADYSVRNVLLQGNTEQGERIITNLFQLIELVHKTQTHKSLSPLELVGWLKRGIDGMEVEGDEYEQRVESDEEAVKIVTIHKSKGLEYNIVLAPFLDFLLINGHDTCSFRNEHGDYVCLQKEQLKEDQKQLLGIQSEQEHRRLIYVAITRAVYKCFVYKNTGTGKYNYSHSSLAPFLTACQQKNSPLVQITQALATPEGYFYPRSERGLPLSGVLQAKNFSLQQNYWRRVSYSSLAAKGEAGVKNTAGAYRDGYDEFVFSQLAKGANTGNMVHYIFENAPFGREAKWESIVERAIEQFSPKQKDVYCTGLLQMLHQVLHTEIQIGTEHFNMAKVDAAKCIHEFEFDFKVAGLYPKALNALSNEKMMVAVKDLAALEGMMNGKIDLFFEQGGKYYILDWKSNFLGDSLADYHRHKVEEAMNENNYHLQYLIYSVAANKYLKSRLGNAYNYEKHFGGVIYLFVRGMRKDSPFGIFTTRPEIDLLIKLENILADTSVLPTVRGINLEVAGEVKLKEE